MFNELRDKKKLVIICRQTQQCILILILMETCFGPSEHHLAILQKSDIQVTVHRDHFL